ncbi:asparagine synthase-related protein [Erythrobacter oryzae]|uniref:asparagine synthase-related protein n=1 Tax=Erythrobacter oryzae TaxID=3019556 RepID=UPI002553CB93|nr:asparagine synthase-related protein [Erythrobacter sp. COR-2]
MSGICAVLRLNGAPAETASLAPVLAVMEARGPDGSALDADGPAAFGHALNATTPEAVVEPMPYRHPGSGCIITAHVRLDNRAELMADLGLTSGERVVGDGELIVCAYLRWGYDCLPRLLGDFAFALWDPRAHRLLCARDKVGMRQLTYHFAPGRLFACATDPEALAVHAEVPDRINEARVADFIDQLEAIDHVSTFFECISRLPPAHALVIEDGALRQWRYWELAAPGPVIHRASDAEYDAAFLDVFTEAVRARLRSPAPVGAMLSGGMDSGTVTAIAAALLHEAGAPPLRTFSGIDTDPACPESACVRASVAHIPHIAPQLVSPEDAESFREEVMRLTTGQSDPFDVGMVFSRSIYVAARRAGIRVMLDGVGGDTTLATGDMVAHHLRRGEVRAAVRDALAQERYWGDEAKALPALMSAARRLLVPESLRERRRATWQEAEVERLAARSMVAPNLAARVDMPARRRANMRHITVGQSNDQANQARRMLHPYIIVARERYDRVAGAIGIEPRDPFLDVRVLEFCLTLPPEQLHGRGWAKFIMRRSMAGRLPDSVRWKLGRDHVGFRFVEIFLGTAPQVLDDSASSNLARYVRNAPEGGEFALRCSEDGVVSETDLIYLAFWLAKFNTSRD